MSLVGVNKPCLYRSFSSSISIVVCKRNANIEVYPKKFDVHKTMLFGGERSILKFLNVHDRNVADSNRNGALRTCDIHKKFK